MKKKKWVRHIPLLIVEITVLLIAVGVLYVTLRTTSEVKKDNLNENEIAVNQQVKQSVQGSEENESKTQQTEESEYSGIYNIAFFGVDSRDENLGKGNRSDTIMICSVNMDTREIRLISIYRDTYLNIGNDTYKKCNSAYAYGGPQQALGMINMNTDLYITDYVTVGFSGLMNAVDALGGVEINVSEAEIKHLNNYQISMVGTTTDGEHFTATAGKDYTPVTTAGRQVLNGLQATAYCRIRYVGDDFARAERQRNLLIAMMEKAKTVSIGSLTGAVDAVLPYVRTSVDIGDIVPMLGMIGDFKVTVSDGFPFADMRNGGTIRTEGACVIPTSLEDNVIKLHGLLFDDYGYVPSIELQTFSDRVEADTRGYLQY